MDHFQKYLFFMLGNIFVISVGSEKKYFKSIYLLLKDVNFNFIFERWKFQ